MCFKLVLKYVQVFACLKVQGQEVPQHQASFGEAPIFRVHIAGPKYSKLLLVSGGQVPIAGT